MSSMKEALIDARFTGKLGDMVKQAEKKAEATKSAEPIVTVKKVQRKARIKKVRPSKHYTPRQLYESQVLKTGVEGLGSLRPCSILGLSPGSPALASGNTCRIKWALSDGKTWMVVVRYDTPISVFGISEKVYYGVHAMHELAPCNCRGYTHSEVCKSA